MRIGALLLVAAPLHAQQIMSFEAYQAIDHSEPYIYQLESETGALLYFGSRHSFDPTDTQMDTLAEVWTSFDPEVAFAEGGDLSIDGFSRTQAIERYGEVGLTRWLAQQDSVPVHSLEPSMQSEIAHLKEQGWSDEQLMLFYTLRKVPQSRKQQSSVDLTEAAPRYLESLVQRFDLQGPTTLTQFEDAIGRLLPDVQDWKSIAASYFYPGPQEPSYFTNKVATASNRFRDQYHVERLKEAVRSGERVFAVAGSAHAVMQEPALRSALQ